MAVRNVDPDNNQRHQKRNRQRRKEISHLPPPIDRILFVPIASARFVAALQPQYTA
jgi:hypothetical protein